MSNSKYSKSLITARNIMLLVPATLAIVAIPAAFLSVPKHSGIASLLLMMTIGACSIVLFFEGVKVDANRVPPRLSYTKNVPSNAILGEVAPWTFLIAPLICMVLIPTFLAVISQALSFCPASFEEGVFKSYSDGAVIALSISGLVALLGLTKERQLSHLLKADFELNLSDFSNEQVAWLLINLGRRSEFKSNEFITSSDLSESAKSDLKLFVSKARAYLQSKSKVNLSDIENGCSQIPHPVASQISRLFEENANRLLKQ